MSWNDAEHIQDCLDRDYDPLDEPDPMERACHLFSCYDTPYSAQKQCEAEGIPAEAIARGEKLWSERRIDRMFKTFPTPVELKATREAA